MKRLGLDADARTPPARNHVNFDDIGAMNNIPDRQANTIVGKPCRFSSNDILRAYRPSAPCMARTSASAPSGHEEMLAVVRKAIAAIPNLRPDKRHIGPKTSKTRKSFPKRHQIGTLRVKRATLNE